MDQAGIPLSDDTFRNDHPFGQPPPNARRKSEQSGFARTDFITVIHWEREQVGVHNRCPTQAYRVDAPKGGQVVVYECLRAGEKLTVNLRNRWHGHHSLLYDKQSLSRHASTRPHDREKADPLNQEGRAIRAMCQIQSEQTSA